MSVQNLRVLITVAKDNSTMQSVGCQPTGLKQETSMKVKATSTCCFFDSVHVYERFLHTSCDFQWVTTKLCPRRQNTLQPIYLVSRKYQYHILGNGHLNSYLKCSLHVAVNMAQSNILRYIILVLYSPSLFNVVISFSLLPSF